MLIAQLFLTCYNEKTKPPPIALVGLVGAEKKEKRFNQRCELAVL